MNKLKVGVIGAGAWGKNHVRTLAGMADVELAAVCDANAGTRGKLTAQYPDALITDSPAALFQHVEAVVIASPAPTHAELALEAIRAGIPALVEKPFALSVADAVAMAEAAEQAKVPLLVGHLLEHHPIIERIKGMIHGGPLGTPYYLYSQRVNLGQVRPDENALWSLGPHDVSVALYLLGETPTHVAAHGHAYLQPGIEDVVFLIMSFASGVVAHAQLSWLDPHKERKLTVVGSRQMVVFDDMAPREKLRIYDKGVDRKEAFVSAQESLTLREGDIAIPKVGGGEPLPIELAHFVRVARGAPAERTDAADGVRVVRVLEAASRSLAAGGVPMAVETVK
ncbi:MAG TPA: Gfo/Idh/MocA family oxidoreductase [Gemmatimonadales bacterium]|nr:Gfo/Idh/MocA family oxidoreductase [Gemmatimonadales bacterium]